MQSFKDTNGKTWTVELNVAGIKRARAATGFDLCKLYDDSLKGLTSFLADFVLLVDVLYCLCRDQADAAGISDEDFGRLMAGDTLGRASDAFVEAYTDFLQDQRQRDTVRALTVKGKKAMERMLELAASRVESLDVEELARGRGHSPAPTSGTPSGSVPASSS